MLNSNALKALFGGSATNDNGDSNDSGSRKNRLNTVHIVGLTRTFQPRELEGLVSKYGAVKYWWVNKINSEAYVVYEAAESAEAALRGLSGLQWPQSSTKTLQTTFSTEDIFKSIVRDDAQRGDNPLAAELWKKLFPDEELVVNQPKEEKDEEKEGKRKGDAVDMFEPLRKLLKSGSASTSAQENGNIKEEVERNEEEGEEEATESSPLQKVPVDKLYMKTVTEPHIYYLPAVIEEEEDEEEKRENGNEEEGDRNENVMNDNQNAVVVECSNESIEENEANEINEDSVI